MKAEAHRARETRGRAQNVLGRMYLNGDTFPRNNRKAIKCFREAAELGDKNAQYSLGRLYQQGKEVNRNCERCHADDSDANGKNVDDSCHGRALVCRRGSGLRGCAELPEQRPIWRMDRQVSDRTRGQGKRQCARSLPAREGQAGVADPLRAPERQHHRTNNRTHAEPRGRLAFRYPAYRRANPLAQASRGR